MLSPQPIRYTVAGSNHGNPPAITTITISVVAVPPSSLSYNPSSFTYTRNQNFSGTFPVPTVTGQVKNYGISPALPTGLVLGR